MAIEYSVKGWIRIKPSVPLAQLAELIEGESDFEVAPLGLDVPELATLARRARWLLVPDDSKGTDGQGRPQAIRALMVIDPSIYSFGINRRLRELSAWMGARHAFDGNLSYEGEDEGDVGLIEPYEDGEDPEWHHQVGPRTW